MVGLIQELACGGKLRIVAAYQTIEIEPAQLHGEQQLQQGGEEEGRQRDAYQRTGGDGVVCAGILLCGSNDAQRDSDDELQHQRDGTHDKGDPDHVVELLEHGHGVLPAVAEVAAHGVAQPGKEAQHNVLVQTILGIELRDPLFIGLCARCHG